MPLYAKRLLELVSQYLSVFGLTKEEAEVSEFLVCVYIIEIIQHPTWMMFCKKKPAQSKIMIYISGFCFQWEQCVHNKPGYLLS